MDTKLEQLLNNESEQPMDNESELPMDNEYRRQTYDESERLKQLFIIQNNLINKENINRRIS